VASWFQYTPETIHLSVQHRSDESIFSARAVRTVYASSRPRVVSRFLSVHHSLHYSPLATALLPIIREPIA
jgi:hypothetical protein